MPEERPRANGQPIVLRDVPTVTIETEFRQPVQHMQSRDENAGHPTATLQMTAEIEPAASTENGQEPIQALADSEEEAEEEEEEEEEEAEVEEAEEDGVVVLNAAEDGDEVELNLSEILALERASEQQQQEIVEQNITETVSVQTQPQDMEIEPEPVARTSRPPVRFRGRRGIHRVRYVRERPEPVRDAVLRGNRRHQRVRDPESKLEILQKLLTIVQTILQM
ncbi:histone acetyltransferase KAT6B-like [Perca fluviatilis]|uniref:histone acetyltransferase KAT6B-like n=1 Tax=Perca fluviatilis TaxID=8168 RepID=UPI001962501A|nr:histone acetyltransferase KAT6B-like [Perca fluviatilis]